MDFDGPDVVSNVTGQDVIIQSVAKTGTCELKTQFFGLRWEGHIPLASHAIHELPLP
jgi:hypothetical protein